MLEINYQNGKYSVLWNGTDLTAEITRIDFDRFKAGEVPRVQITAVPEMLRMNLDTNYVNVKVPSGKAQQAKDPPPPCGLGNNCLVRSDGSCPSTSGNCTC